MGVKAGPLIQSREEKYIEAFEMWCYRRLLRIPRTQHKTSEWILCKLKVDRDLLDRVKLGFYCHTIRKYESLEKEIVQGCLPGNRNRGRQRRRWTDGIAEWTGGRSLKRLQQRNMVVIREGYYAPQTLLMEEDTLRLLRRSPVASLSYNDKPTCLSSSICGEQDKSVCDSNISVSLFNCLQNSTFSRADRR